MNKILVLAEMYPPQVEGIALSTWKFCCALAQRGFELTVISAAAGGAVEQWWTDPRIRLLRLPQLPGRLPRRLAGNLGRLYLRTYWGSWWAAGAYRAADRLIQTGGFRLLVTRTEPASGIVVGCGLARRHKICWLAAINDPHPTCLYPPPYGPGRPSTLRDRRQCRWVARALESAAAVVVPCSKLERLERDHRVLPPGVRAFVIPHCGLPADPDPSPSSSQHGSIELAHVGVISSRNRGIQLLVETLKRMEGADPELAGRYTVRLIGTVDQASRQLVAQSDFDRRFAFLPQLPPRECMQAIRGADALLLIEAPLREGVFLPGKYADYVSSGRPTLMFSPMSGAIADLVGGAAHPGFLSQDAKTAAERLAVFLRRKLGGDPCSDYVLPAGRGIAPGEHADMWREAFSICAGVPS